MAVNQHGAGAAHAVLAADVGARQAQLVAQEIGEVDAGLHTASVFDTVDIYFDIANVHVT